LNSLGHHRPWDLDSVHSFVLGAFLSGSLDNRSSIWDNAVDDSACVDVDTVEPLICSKGKHLVEDELLGSQYDSIFAVNSDDGAGILNCLLGVLYLKESSLWR
jgi:hypothetical protein